MGGGVLGNKLYSGPWSKQWGQEPKKVPPKCPGIFSDERGVQRVLLGQGSKRQEPKEGSWKLPKISEHVCIYRIAFTSCVN